MGAEQAQTTDWAAKTILLVEDEALIAMDEAQTLKKHGFEVVIAYNGKKAIEKVNTESVDLVLMDIDLGSGKMDGTEAAEIILENHELPIVFLTSHAEKEYVDKVKKITGYGYVLKNSGEFVLIESINMAFDLFEAHMRLKKENEERKQTDIRNKKYHNLLTSTLVAVDSLLMVIDRDYRIIFCNWRDHEWVPEEERDRSPICYEVMKNYDSPCPYCPPQKTFQDGQPRWYEDKNPIDGSYKEISVVPIFDEGGNVEYVLENVRDVTNRKRMEERLKNSEKQLRAVFETAQDYIFIKNKDLEYKLVNPAIAQLFGMSQKELVGKTDNDLFGKSIAEDMKEEDDRVLNGEIVIEERVVSLTGESKTFQVVKAPMQDDKGNVIGICGISRDITEQKKTEQELKESERKLKQALGEKDYLMQELNHRVKNNLLMISSLIGLKDEASGEMVDLSDISRQIDAIRIVHEKLYQTEEIITIDFREYVEDLLTTVFSFSEKNVRIENNTQDISIQTRTAIPLGLIVNEVATNAIKHGFTQEEKAVFSVTLEKDERKNKYILTLSNTGRPFPKEIDLDNPETLGLRLIDALVDQLDGGIELQREPQPVFTIRFPVEEDPSQ